MKLETDKLVADEKLKFMSV